MKKWMWVLAAVVVTGQAWEVNGRGAEPAKPVLLPVPRHYVTGLYLKVPNHKATESVRGHNRSMWPYDMILDRGYGVATASYDDVEIDAPGHWSEGPRGMAAEPQAGDWGTIGAWAWALSRAMDYLETEPRVDARRVAVFGFSRLGKTAMWAGARDERFAAVISQESGKGGVSLTKHLAGEPLSHLAGKDLAHWFARDYQQYIGQEGRLPVDGHDLAALVAPRGLLILSDTTDTYSDPEGEFLSGVAATPVYRLLGNEGLTRRDWPREPAFVNSRLGYPLHAGGHNVTTADWQATLDWADRHLRE